MAKLKKIPKRIFIIVIFIIAIGLVIGMIYFLPKGNTSPLMQDAENKISEVFEKTIDFSEINQEFSFSAKIPKEFEVEYVSNVRAINIYNPSQTGDSNIEKSKIYVSFFKASKFLTLNTVEITQQDKVTVQGREAILYEITKKETVPNFTGQPTWRNVTHKAIDIRASQNSPSYFYSFAKNPDLSQKIFDDFINSLNFY